MTPRIHVIKEILLAGATHVAPPTSKPLDRPGFLFFFRADGAGFNCPCRPRADAGDGSSLAPARRRDRRPRRKQLPARRGLRRRRPQRCRRRRRGRDRNGQQRGGFKKWGREYKGRRELHAGEVSDGGAALADLASWGGGRAWGQQGEGHVQGRQPSPFVSGRRPHPCSDRARWLRENGSVVLGSFARLGARLCTLVFLCVVFGRLRRPRPSRSPLRRYTTAPIVEGVFFTAAGAAGRRPCGHGQPIVARHLPGPGRLSRTPPRPRPRTGDLHNFPLLLPPVQPHAACSAATRRRLLPTPRAIY